MRAIVRWGLTGGIGSGKSTVAAMLETLGAAIVDADLISRAATATGGAAIAPIAREFGAGFIDCDGAMDRGKMRDLAYSDSSARSRLEAIVHPLVGLEIARQTNAALIEGHNWIVFDIPLLVESSRWRQNLDKVMVLDCTPAMQIRRVIQRSGLDCPSIEKIIASQASREKRVRGADIVLFNDTLSIDHLKQAVTQIVQEFGLSSP